MKLLTKELIAKLNKAGYDNETPICKLFTPWGRATWLITGMEDGILYGYADLGMGYRIVTGKQIGRAHV